MSIDVDNLTLGQIKQLQSIFGQQQPQQPHPAIGKYVIVRTYSAGVHFGTLVSANGKEVQLSNARRLWNWSGAFTLSAVAIDGVTSATISAAVPQVFLTEAIEITPMSDKAADQLRAYKEHKP